MPPMFGDKQLANFEVYSYPQAGIVRAWACRRCCWSWRWSSPGDSAPARRTARGARDRSAAACRRAACCWRSPAPAAGAGARRGAGRPRGPPGRRGRVSPLQARVDAAPPGRHVEVAAGTYGATSSSTGRCASSGSGRPRLVGLGRRAASSAIRADDVTRRGLRHRRAGRRRPRPRLVGRPRRRRRARRSATAASTRTLFGVYLREAHGARVERCRDRRHSAAGTRARRAPGIHVWNTDGFRSTATRSWTCATASTSSRRRTGCVAGNVARDLRYGLHYMFSDDNVFEDNLFENGAAGTALMYSRRITFRRNRFLHNRGFASVGLLFKACDDVVAEDNLIADNARGIFLEGSYRERVPPQRHRRVRHRHRALRLVRRRTGSRATRSSRNLTPLTARRPAHRHRRSTATTGRTTTSRTSTATADATGPTACRASSTTSAATSPPPTCSRRASRPRRCGAAERTFPVLEPIAVEDRARSRGRRRCRAVPRPERADASARLTRPGRCRVGPRRLGAALGRRRAPAAPSEGGRR